ncbi:MAG: putative Ig domain-containing protein, partial [Brevefilum sp.]|nr:putative Ig domain-containing protein [Brevefilum sp.]
PVLCDTEEITVTVAELNQAPVLGAIGNKTVDELSLLSFTATGTDPDLPANTLTFSLEGAPIGASIDPASGAFSWTPTEAQGPGQYTFTVKVCDNGTPVLCDTEPITVTVNEDLSQVSIPLYEGWNLVSFNLVPPSTAVADVLASIEGNYTLVYAWAPNDPNDPWLLYDPAALYASDLTDIDHSMGFWIKMAAADTLVITGTQPETTSISLTTGWNLVGYPAAQSQILPDALENNGITDYDLVMAYHAPEFDPWLLYDPTAPSYANDLTEMAPGWGYWVEVNTSGTWDLPYSLP